MVPVHLSCLCNADGPRRRNKILLCIHEYLRTVRYEGHTIKVMEMKGKIRMFIFRRKELRIIKMG